MTRAAWLARPVASGQLGDLRQRGDRSDSTIGPLGRHDPPGQDVRVGALPGAPARR